MDRTKAGSCLSDAQQKRVFDQLMGQIRKGGKKGFHTIRVQNLPLRLLTFGTKHIYYCEHVICMYFLYIEDHF